MFEKLKKIRQENPNIDRDFMNTLAKTMPKLLEVMLDGYLYKNHIGTKDVAMLAEPYIKNSENEQIGFKWGFNDVLNYAEKYVDFKDKDIEFTPYDVFVWANVMYGDISDITTDISSIVDHTINDLLDYDYPYYDASHKAYCWLKQHVINDENK